MVGAGFSGWWLLSGSRMWMLNSVKLGRGYDYELSKGLQWRE